MTVTCLHRAPPRRTPRPASAPRPAADPPAPRRPHRRLRAAGRLPRRAAGDPAGVVHAAGRAGRCPSTGRCAARTGMLEACLTPDLATEITLQPVRRHRVDAAILFSDIVVPLKLAGIDVEIVPGTGPVVAHPVRTAADVAALPPLDPAALAPIIAGRRRRPSQALGSTPLIGFAGAPFTLASYLVEGGPSREHLRTKALMHGDPADLARAGRLGGRRDRRRSCAPRSLAGASAVQLFDSWAGALSLPDYTRFVAPHSAAVLAGGRRPRRSPGAFRGRHRRTAGRHAGRRRRRHGRRPPGPAGRRQQPARRPNPVAGQHRSGAAVRRTGRAARARPPTSSGAAPARPGTWSTSATASRRTPTRTC